MHEDVKKAVQTGDVKRLKYIFVDSLDVDPTFENYKEDFDYCSQNNIFENHEVLTKLQKEPSNWTFDYWKSLKKDLTKNFSKKRLLHMTEVAKVIYKDKVERLKKERNQYNNPQIEEKPVKEEVKFKPSNEKSTQNINSPSINSIQEQERQRLEEARKKIEEENRAIERKMAEQRAKTEAMRRASEEAEAKRQEENNSSPFSLGTLIGGALIGIGSALLGGKPNNKPPKKNH